MTGSEVPRVLGRYEVLGELARGGMASVHLGRVRGAGGFERIVAIKCCHPHLSGDADFASMFLDEARIAARIHHPNVVATLDVGNDGPVLYHVMEYVEGERLVDLLKAAKRDGASIDLAIISRIMIDVLHGLHAAHELTDGEGRPLEVVHRDVSPQNVMVGTDGIARIMDFGIARAAARSTVTEKGVVKGKFSYMAPEQLLGQEIDRRCDVFAAGVVLWETLVGKRLFAGDSQGETVQRVMHVPVEPPSRARPDAKPLDDVVLRALARPVDDRYASALAFADAIEASGAPIAKPLAVAAHVRAVSGAATEKKRVLIRRAELETPTEQSLAEPTVVNPARRPRLIFFAALGVLLLVPLIAILVWAWSGDEEPPPPRVARPAEVVEEPPPPPPPEPEVVQEAAPVEPAPPPIEEERPAPRRRRRPPRQAQGESPEYIPRSL